MSPVTSHATQDKSERKNRTAPNGCLRFDRRFAECGVPRLQHSSGTRDADEFERRNKILTRLAKGRYAETLRAFAIGEISIEDLVRFDEEGNLKYGLRDLRRKRAEIEQAEGGPYAPEPYASAAVSMPTPVPRPAPAPMPAPVQVPTPASTISPARVPTLAPMPAVAPAPALAPTSAPTEPEDPEQAKLRMPLWTAAFDVAIPDMTDIEPDSRRRYATSILSLKQKLGAFALSEASYETLADMSPELWGALYVGRMRGLTVAALRELTALDVPTRRERLRADRRRVGEDAFATLAGMTDAEWGALASAAEYPIDEELIFTLEREGPQQRAVLRRIGAILGPAATVADLDRLTDKDWRTLSRDWCASASDWNHMRRSLSAVISTLFGTHRHPLRHRVIDRIPLKKEKERVPNISREKLAEVVAQLPEPIRLFPWFLVLSGVRIGEYLRLKPSHLMPHVCAIDVPGTKTEGSRRTVYIEESAWWVVEATVPSPLGYGRLRHQWIAACARAGVTGVTLHDLRHCSGQWAVEGGADEGALQHHFGHATRDMTQRYTKRVNQGRAASALSGLVLPYVQAPR